jgi:DNA-binding transcriptional regulator YdaS (Cro superfamily)
MAMQPEDVRQIIIRAGGHAALASRLGRARQTVYQWQQIPAKYAKTVARLARMRVADVRPDVFG